jgi:hypothetical protein
MSIPGSANPLLLTSAGAYSISRSVRLNSADSAYFSRTPASSGNRKTWTWAGWVKRSGLGSGTLFSVSTTGTPASDDNISFDSSTNSFQVQFYESSTLNARVLSASVFRDVSAWYHFVVSVDTTQAAEANRIKVYANGSQITSFSTATYPSQNYDSGYSTTNRHSIGRNDGNATAYFSGYLADIHFIDGQALDPTSFGFFDSNGIWQPKAYTGTYGTNGFHLDFADNSTTTSGSNVGIGKDISGNGNYWDSNNISVAAGAGNDSLVDVPTNGTETDTGLGGEVRGNYATFNPISVQPGYRGTRTLTNGNLDYRGDENSPGLTAPPAESTIGVTSGKWYCEMVFTNTFIGDGSGIGISGPLGFGFIRNESTPYFVSLIPGVSDINPFGSNFTIGDVLGVALDLDNGTLDFYKNGSTYGSQIAGIPASTWFFWAWCRDSGGSGGFSAVTANFGQRPFAYTAPSGFKALCTANLPSTTITTSGSYTGNGVADGPFVYLNGVPTAMTIEGNAVTFGTDADKLSNGFKIRTTSTTYNLNASVYNYSITSTGDPFKTARAQSN